MSTQTTADSAKTPFEIQQDEAAELEKIVRRRLKELRLSHYPVIRDFCIKTTIYDANVRKIEARNSRTLPGLRNLMRWVGACGLTLTEFFAEVEAIAAGGELPPEHPIVGTVKALVARDPETADAVLRIAQQVMAFPPVRSGKKRRR